MSIYCRTFAAYIVAVIILLTVVDVSYASECRGKAEPPSYLHSTFREIQNNQLLNKALGKPLEGGLCQGKVYVLDKAIRLYRAFNSTNPISKTGVWWAFFPPKGAIENYRKDYEICYQWSPLDKLVSCQVNAGTEVVIGNGQSAKCSPYLTYPVSAEKQIYISEPMKHLTKCETSTAVFSWRSM